MTALVTALCLVLFSDAGLRLAAVVAPASSRGVRAALALVLGAALLCAGYGVLGSICTRERAEIELVFHGDAVAAPRDSTTQGAGELRAIEERVTRPRATPRHLLPLALAASVLARLAIRRRRRARPRRLDRRLLLLGVPLFLSGLAALRSTPRGYDALWYHLPMAAAFARQGHLEPPGRDLVFYFPGNAELLARSLGDLAGGPGQARTVHAMALVQWPFALALAALTAALARRIGARRGAAYAGALVLACPLVIFQAGVAYADVIAAGALVAALVAFLRAATAARARERLLAGGAAGLALGLAAGSKYAALPLLAAGLPCLALAALAGPAGRLRAREAPRAIALLLVVGLGLVLPAWFWFARNLRLTGNPIFPIALPSLGLRGLFLPRAFNAGKELELVGGAADWAAFAWTEPLGHESGFGPAFAALVPLALLPLVLVFGRALRRGRWPRFALPLTWGLGYATSWWLGTPHEARHLLPVLPLLGAPACLLLGDTRPLAVGLRRVGRVALLAGALVVLRLQLFSPTPELSIRAWSFADLYGMPADLLDRLPAGAKVANLASRPYNLALLGPRLTLQLLEFSPSLPSANDLDYQGAGYVFARGGTAQIAAIRAQAEAPDPGRPLVERARVEVPGGRPWSFWGGGPSHPADSSESIVIFQRANVGDAERPR